MRSTSALCRLIWFTSAVQFTLHNRWGRISIVLLNFGFVLGYFSFTFIHYFVNGFFF